MSNYTINYDQDDLIEAAVRDWVLEWCEKYHPEVFERAREFIRLASEKQHEGAV
jgi:hypothetical protein